jgi:hypothetical protein
MSHNKLCPTSHPMYYNKEEITHPMSHNKVRPTCHPMYYDKEASTHTMSHNKRSPTCHPMYYNKEAITRPMSHNKLRHTSHPMYYDKEASTHPMSHNKRSPTCHPMYYDKEASTHPMSHSKRSLMSKLSNILFKLCMHECMVCVACLCRNVCTKYSYTLLCWVSRVVWDVRIKAHDWSIIHGEGRTIGREAGKKKNASIIHSFRNARKWCVLIVIMNVNSSPIVTSNCKSNPLCKFLFAVECSRKLIPVLYIFELDWR